MADGETLRPKLDWGKKQYFDFNIFTSKLLIKDVLFQIRPITWVDTVLPASVAIVIEGIKHMAHFPSLRRKHMVYFWLLRCVAK